MDKATSAAKVLDGHACFGMLEETDDLFISEYVFIMSVIFQRFADSVLISWYGLNGVSQNNYLQSIC